MKISVILPVYNVQEYIEQCIESVVNQEYSNLEILLINDGSTDDSEEICRKYEKSYTTIKLFNKTNGGLSDARNYGIKKATGDYIIFLDTDDFWDTSFLSDMVDQITNEDVILFRYKYYNDKNGSTLTQNYNIDKLGFHEKNGVKSLEYILNKMPFFRWYAWASLVRRTYILENALYFKKGCNYEDALWTPEVILKSHAVGYYDKIITTYRLEREGQITSNVSLKNLKDSIYILKHWELEINKYKASYALKKNLLKNLSDRYFYAFKYYSTLDEKNEREEIYKLLQKEKHMLKYAARKNDILIKYIGNIVGFEFLIRIVSTAIKIKSRGLNVHGGEIQRTK